MNSCLAYYIYRRLHREIFMDIYTYMGYYIHIYLSALVAERA